MIRLPRSLSLRKPQPSEPQGSFNPEQHTLEAAVRGRTARKVRAHLRRMDPVVLTTPRWSEPQGFLEDLALDLAVGEPAIGCRTVSFRPLKGRPAPEAWFFMLQIFAQLGADGSREVRPPLVVDRRGFRTMVRTLLCQAQDRGAVERVALLGHSAEHLPVEVLEDVAECWAEFARQTPEDRACTLLLSGTVDTPNLGLSGSVGVELSDFGEAEAAATLIGQTGPVGRRELEGAARFSGGIPAVVQALGQGARAQGALPVGNTALLRCMGPLAEEIRGALTIASGHPDLAERLEQLTRGEPLVEVPEVDRPLQLAGLIRRVRLPGEGRVMLRAPALATCVG